MSYKVDFKEGRKLRGKNRSAETLLLHSKESRELLYRVYEKEINSKYIP